MLSDTLTRTISLAPAVVFSAGFALAMPLLAQSSADVEMSGISGSPQAPRHHFRLRNPAALGSAEAERIYHIASESLRTGYAASGVAEAQVYQSWRRFNTAPYLSSTHGNHYINNYANETGHVYGRFEEAGKLPVGTVIAKDSFAVTETGGILLGPLFVIEKLPAGFNEITGDWRYKLVQPDGTFFGETEGRGAERVEYCIACHWAVEHQDHLYFIPRDY
ncbi:MAG: hypothetical protein OET44_01335, partial [Gammaproteobacteria bacterium]|nr:hypothetical protein [Gammaproteobacteria bacterium]